MSKELIVGKKAEDELTQLLDTLCGGGLCGGKSAASSSCEMPSVSSACDVPARWRTSSSAASQSRCSSARDAACDDEAAAAAGERLLALERHLRGRGREGPRCW